MSETNHHSSRGKELAKNTLILSFGTILPRLSSFITLPIITSVVSKVDLGTYDYMVTLVSLLIPVITLQIHLAAFRFLIDVRGDALETSRIITNIFIFVIPTATLSAVVYFIFLYKYSLLYRVLLSTYLFTQLQFTVSQQIMRGLSKNTLFSISAIINSLLNTISIVLFVYFRRYGLVGLLVSVVAANFTSSLYLLIRGNIFNYFDFSHVSFSTIIEMLQYSWPIVPNSLSNWVLQISDRLVLTAFWGVEAVAVYGIANKIPSLLNLVQSTFSFAWQENASLSVKDDNQEIYYSHMFDTIFSILSGGFAAILAVAPILFAFLIRGDYGDALIHIPILLMALLFSALASFMSGIYVAHKKTKSIGITTVCAAAINLVIDLSFVAHIGIFAASISTLVSYIFLTVFRIVDSHKFQIMHYQYLKIGVVLLILVTMCVFYSINSYASLFINIVIAIALNLKLNFYIILSGIQMISRK